MEQSLFENKNGNFAKPVLGVVPSTKALSIVGSSRNNGDNGNKCGTTMPYLISELGIDSQEITKLLNQLHKEKFITVRKGINNQLIFLKK